jgi:hypothetical protein
VVPAVEVDPQVVATDFSDIEEALAELFEAESLIASVEAIARPESVLALQKIRRATLLLDRPWR